MPPKCHTEEKLHPGHGLVARADADAALHQMVLEILDIIWRGSLWPASEPGRKSLAGAQMTGLGCSSDIAPCHVRNHPRKKGRNWFGVLNVHGKTLCQPRQNYLEQQQTPDLKNRATNLYPAQHPQQAPLSRSDLVLEPKLLNAALRASRRKGRIADVKKSARNTP
jgi:hypothetical protein